MTTSHLDMLRRLDLELSAVLEAPPEKATPVIRPQGHRSPHPQLALFDALC